MKKFLLGKWQEQGVPNNVAEAAYIWTLYSRVQKGFFPFLIRRWTDTCWTLIIRQQIDLQVCFQFQLPKRILQIANVSLFCPSLDLDHFYLLPPVCLAV